jgi:hypothetical protein
LNPEPVNGYLLYHTVLLYNGITNKIGRFGISRAETLKIHLFGPYVHFFKKPPENLFNHSFQIFRVKPDPGV